jgi:protein tyrosine phosphatase (PTP) superfamily phosphohydrolase (DUF442 family)/cytochrome c556
MKLAAAALLVSSPILLLACVGSRDHAAAPAMPVTKKVSIPAPLRLDGKAYDAATLVELPKQAPAELPGLHNVYRLSENIVSGSEPHGEEGLQSIAALGVRTVISVDGSAPDHEGAAKHGLRYVHVPIQYKGITKDEVLKLSKTFRELEGPIFVYCFHGKHRGPAAAAIGRLALDGVARQIALAEMRQYCGTAGTYEGLYKTVAEGELPTYGETESYAFDFAPVHKPEGLVSAMAVIARASDNVADAAKRGWQAGPSHPDLDALNEAEKLEQAFAAAFDLGETKTGPADQRGWFERSHAETTKLVGALKRWRGGETAAAAEAKTAFETVKGLCTECHAVYRN